MKIGKKPVLDVPALHPHPVRYPEPSAARNPLQKILVVIDPAAARHHCIEKAARIASAAGGSIELFSCDARADLPETWAGGTTLAAYRGVIRERQVGALEGLAKPLRARGLTVTTEAVCSERVEEAIVERAIRMQADLVMKDVQPPSPSPSPTRIDWLLIREVPCPLLLARPVVWPSHPRICVAVDPCHPADRPATLDESMIATGGILGRALDGVVEIMHTLQSPPHLPGEDVADAVRQKAHAHARAAVENLAHRTGIAATAIHFLPERVPEGILQLAESAGADMVVMGAGARPRVQYSAASTASLVLDLLNCDLLIVKAPGFVSPVLEE